MMKKVWLVLLAVVLVFGLVVSCGGGGGKDDDEGESEAFSFEGPWDDIIKPYGNNPPTITGNEIAVTASSSTGFFINFEDIGYTYNSEDILIFTYEVVEITTPSAVITLKNPKAWGSDMASNSAWGVGKGREYVLGDETKSNYSGADYLVEGTYDTATKIGTFEVLARLLTGATAVGFQHNYWAEFSSVKVGENSEYTIKILKIENKVAPDYQIDLPVSGLKPLAGETPKTTVETDQFTGTVTWEPAPSGAFEVGKTYTATITLTKKSGYTFAGIEANTFVVTGATTVTHATGTDTLAITAAFPAVITSAPAKIITFTAGDVVAGNTNTTINETTTDSFTYTMTAGYGPFAYFKVTFASGYTLSDYSKLDITFEGLSGDSGYKRVRLAASADAPTSVSENGYTFLSAQNGDKDGDGHAAAKFDTITDFSNVSSANDLNEVYIAVYVWSGAAKWKISGIKFYN